MKKNYITPAVSIIKFDNSLMQMIISSTQASQEGECESKKNTVSFYDDDEDGVTAGW